MPAKTRQPVGREEELGAIVRLLDAPEQLSGAAVLSGEAGIGKTTVWLAGIDAAADRGYRILSSRPSEAETHFSFGGLADLLGDVTGDVFPELPPIQQRALEAALLISESEIRADDRAVAAAFLGALRALAADSRLCLAVDDIQWLDAASLAALHYALARLTGEPIAALLAVRGDVPAWLRRALPRERLHTVEVGALSVGAIRELFRVRLDATFPRPTLVRLWQTSRGNPFFALELAAALRKKGGTVAAGEELPIPTDLDELLRARLDGLTPAGLEVALAVAALADPTVGVLETALGTHFDPGFADAFDARILEVDDQRVRFTHPLLGSVVAVRLTPARRRSLHARLAECVASPEERARHLALATGNPDGDVAAILEEVARAAHVRGAPAAAAELAKLALRLTPAASPEDTLRRVLLAADMQVRVGDIAGATDLLEPALAAAAPGNERATILAQLAQVQTSPLQIMALSRDALAEARDDALRATIHTRLAYAMRWFEDVERAVEHAELAVRAASRVADAALACHALAAYGAMHFHAGRGIATATMEKAVSLERSLAEWPLNDGPTAEFGLQLIWSADVERGREFCLEFENAAKARNDPAAEAEALWQLGFLAWRAGHWEEAHRYIAESLELYAQLGFLTPGGEFPAPVIDAHRGRIDDARARARAALAWGETEGVRTAQAGYGWLLGFIELSLGDTNAALVHLRRSYEIRNGLTLEPAACLELGDLLEALIAVGELTEADDILATWEARAAVLDRAWTLAILARCRGLLLAARGNLQRAFASFERALAEHARSTDPFHEARTQLALGRTQRRAKKRAAARATLEDALTRFEWLGAPLWAEQVRAELARIGARSASRDELTAAESRIAELVAEGQTNREVAAALFLTVHSVETALTRIYRKLGVRSRAELASRYASKT